MSTQGEAPRLTPRGHRHGEAFCLMWYACRGCGARERIWNSRDGVTPFGMSCDSCGGRDMLHTAFGSDEYAPSHKLRWGQKFWRDGTPDEAEAIMRARIEAMRSTHPLTPEREAQLITDARSEALSGEFQKGWPMLDIHWPPPWLKSLSKVALPAPFPLTAYELRAISESPEALQALADYHDYQETCADAADMSECVTVHRERRKQFEALRDAVQAKRDSGE